MRTDDQNRLYRLIDQRCRRSSGYPWDSSTWHRWHRSLRERADIYDAEHAIAIAVVQPFSYFSGLFAPQSRTEHRTRRRSP